MKRFAFPLLLLVWSLALSACAGLTDTAAARVNGKAIPEDAVTAELEDFRASARYKQLVESGDANQFERQFVQGILAQLVRRAVLTPIAEEQGLEVTDEDVDAEMDKIKADFPDDTAFQEALKEQALTEEKLRQLVADRLLEDTVRRDVTGGIAASPEEVRAFYDENIETFQSTCAQHILVQDDQTARLISHQLQDASPGEVEDLFAKLAKEHSIDTSNARSAGDLGCNPPGQFVPEFETAMNDLEIGEVSEPVNSQFGVHIIRVTDRKTSPFEEVAQQIFEQLTGPRQDEAWTEYITAAYEEANVEIDSRYGVLDIATGQILDPSAADIPAAQRPKAERPEEPVDVPGPGEPTTPPEQ